MSRVGSHVGRFGRWLGIVLALSVTAAAWAGPKEDYEEGLKTYERGDYASAIKPLMRAAEAGHSKAQALLGSILDAADNDAEAAKWYLKAAEAGEPEGQLGLGMLYVSGDGVMKDRVEARKWLVKAAAQDFKPAWAALAGSHLSGIFPTDETNREEVMVWVRWSVSQNDIAVLEGLAKVYREGLWGLPPDAKLAAEYQGKANQLRGLKKSGKR